MALGGLFHCGKSKLAPTKLLYEKSSSFCTSFQYLGFHATFSSISIRRQSLLFFVRNIFIPCANLSKNCLNQISWMTFETRDCRERISRSPGGTIFLSTEFNTHPEFELFAESSISAIVGIALFFIGKTFANILFNVFFSVMVPHRPYKKKIPIAIFSRSVAKSRTEGKILQQSQSIDFVSIFRLTLY